MSSSLLKNSFYISIARILHRVLGLLGTLVVARILAPEDYGVIAACMLVQELAMRMQNIGFQQNIVTKKDLDISYIDTGFFLRVLLGLGFSLMVYALAGPAAVMLNNMDCKPVLEVLAWSFVFTSLVNPNVTLAIKDNNYVPELMCHVLSKIVSVGLTVYLALTFRNYWALAIGMLVSPMAYCVISYWVVKPHWPKRFVGAQALDFFRFSIWVTMDQMVDYVNANASKILIARYFTDKVMGYFSVGKNLCFMYGQEVSAALDNANLSTLSKQLDQNTAEKHHTILGDSLDYLFSLKNIVVLPVYTFFICYPEFIIRVLFGENWLDMAPFFVWFSVAAVLASYRFTVQTVFNCIRKPKIPFYGVLIQIVVTLGLLPVAVIWDSAIWLAVGSFIGQTVGLSFLMIVLTPHVSWTSMKSILILTVWQTAKYGLFAAISLFFDLNAIVGGVCLLVLVVTSFLAERVWLKTAAYNDIYNWLQSKKYKFL